MKKTKSVVVVGSGIAGIQASLDLAEIGAEVHLVEKTPSIGGRMAQLDKTFPTNDCSLCILSPKMSECARHPGITLHMNSELLSIDGESGDFSVKIKENATYIDADKCVNCGLCEEKCPTKVTDEFDAELRERKAIYRYFLQSVPANYVIDPKYCLKITKGVCGLCEKTCPAEAIDFDDTDKEIAIDCGAVILATGIDAFDPLVYGQYGYKKFPNVVTSLEFERMLCASGPLMGHVVCPGNDKEPKNIAFIQCVGSRDRENAKNYCSSVCCMYAIKEAIIAREHIKGLDATIFFMDVRAYGKDFDRYYERAEKQFGVEFIRSRVAKITELPGGDLRVHYANPDGSKDTRDFSLVVLSVGIQPRKDIQQLAENTGIKLDEFGFCRTGEFNPLDTTRPGVFVCGAIGGPKDIPESVMAASGAVSRAAKLLELKRQEKVSKKEFPPEKDVFGDRPRIGAFICHCGINIGGIVDVPSVVEYARSLPNVEHAEEVLYACSADCLETIKQAIVEKNLNRVLVAACTPRTHEPLFRETLREAGLNQYLFEMANIRDQCSWAHMNEPEMATIKAKELVEMGIAKARRLTPLQKLPVEIDPKALVIGGGLAGITAALELADAGFRVFLVEKEPQLGGNFARVKFAFNGGDPQAFLAEKIREISDNELVTVYTGAGIKGIDGYIGNFKTTVALPDGKSIELEHGVVIVATGAREYETDEYQYRKSKRVVTQLEFEKLLAEGYLTGKPIQNIVMINCVGSREEGRQYCSRLCCAQSIRNALKVKELRPATDVYVLYRDIRTYGTKEKYFGEAREKGVIFSRYDLETKPTVEPINPENPRSKLRVTSFDPILGRKFAIDADLVVLAVSIDAPAENEELAKMLKVPLNADRFFLEAHVKLRPVDFATDGVFVCGLAHCPKNSAESITQATAAAARAMTVLNKMVIEAEGSICEVNPELCAGCGLCVEVCPYAAAQMDEEKGVAVINEALCKGCGACAASCRSGAIDLRGFTNQQIYLAIDSLETLEVTD